MWWSPTCRTLPPPNRATRTDPFLVGLAAHLRDTGVAFITHNAFVGLDRTKALLAEHHLAAHAILATTVPLHPVKTVLLQPGVREKYLGAGISRLGRYEFVEVQILEIRFTKSL
jgi:hypothetical protein